MSKFTPSVTKHYQFDGDNVTVELNRLSKAAMFSLSPYIGDGSEDSVDVEGMLKKGTDHVAGHIKSMTGLKDADGEEISVHTMVSSAYFITLVSKILVDLFEISQPTEDDAKNSGALSTTESSAQESSEES